MCDLDYESIPVPAATSRNTVAVVVGSIVATPIHLVASACISFQLFRLAGGVTTSGRWTSYGGIDYAWTNISWLPGGLLLAIGDGGPAQPAPLGLFALLLLLVGSIIAAYLCASVVVRLFRSPRDFGRFNWRLWACLLAWLGWVPVPVKMTLTYWHTVAF